MRYAFVAAVGLAASVASAQSLLTSFVSGNQFAGNMFDLTALNPAGVTIDSWDVNMTLPGAQTRVSVYYRTDSYLNGLNTMAGWIEVGTETVTSAGQDQRTPVPIGGLSIPGGATYGIYIFLTDYITNPPPTGVPSWRYMNIPPALTQYANADLQLDGGVGKGSPPFTGSTFNARMFSGEIFYSVGSGGCYPDCDTSTGVGVLDIFDFLCFGNRFSAADPYACDCDTSTGMGVCDIFDFLCFGNAFNNGCP